MLTSRQLSLLSYLQANSDRFLKQSDIVSTLSEEYPYNANLGGFHDSVARHMLTKDIREINASDEVDCIILSTGNGIKIASESEFDFYISSQLAAAVRRIQRIRKLEKKGKKHGYLRLTEYGIETVNAFPDWQTRRREAGLKATEVVEKMKEIEPRFDGSLLSKIENGICLPTRQQEEKFNELYLQAERDGEICSAR